MHIVHKNEQIPGFRDFSGYCLVFELIYALIRPNSAVIAQNTTINDLSTHLLAPAISSL